MLSISLLLVVLAGTQAGPYKQASMTGGPIQAGPYTTANAPIAGKPDANAPAGNVCRGVATIVQTMTVMPSAQASYITSCTVIPVGAPGAQTPSVSSAPTSPRGTAAPLTSGVAAIPCSTCQQPAQAPLSTPPINSAISSSVTPGPQSQGVAPAAAPCAGPGKTSADLAPKTAQPPSAQAQPRETLKNINSTGPASPGNANASPTPCPVCPSSCSPPPAAMPQGSPSIAPTVASEGAAGPAPEAYYWSSTVVSSNGVLSTSTSWATTSFQGCHKTAHAPSSVEKSCAMAAAHHNRPRPTQKTHRPHGHAQHSH